MFFKKKQTAKQVFLKHYISCLEITKESPIINSKDVVFEVLVALYTICDYAAVNSGKNRGAIYDMVFDIIHDSPALYCFNTRTAFDARYSLYAEVIRGKPLRCEWYLGGDPSDFQQNAFTKITALLCDILYNPDCADDYDNAQMCIWGLAESITFIQDVFKPLFAEIVYLFNEIYSLK